MKLQRSLSRISVLLILGFAALAVSGWIDVTRLKAEQSDDKGGQAPVQLPEGNGKEIVAQKCVTCHTLEKVTKEKRTQAEWKDLLEIMVSQGLELTPEEHKTVLQYLIANFGKADAGAPPQTGQPSGGSARKEVTYSKDMAPILNQHCVVCHHPNDIAPMSLMTYKETRPWGAAIREKVVQRLMPPWHADPNIGEFSNDPRLTDAEIGTIREWVNSGMKEGDPKDLPPVPEFQTGWHIKPDVVFTIPEFDVSAGGQDDYEYFHVPTNFTEDKWVEAVEVIPGDRRVVHHAGVALETAEQAAKSVKTANAGEYKEDDYFYCTGKVCHIRPEAPIVDDGCSRPDGGTLRQTDLETKHSGQIGIYLPGHLYEAQLPGYALKIPAGAYLRFDVHYSNSRGLEGVKDRTRVGLVFAKHPVRYEASELEVYNYLFQVPANDPNHRGTVCYTLSKDVIALAYTAHMHYRGKSMTTEAVFPDGHREVIMNVPHYDFRWQETYYLKHPKRLPKGTRLVATAYFDNSANNPLNPDPSKTIRYGDPSYEEMLSFWLQFSDPEPIDQKAQLTK